MRPKVHRIVFTVVLALLGGSMVCSTWMANLAWMLLALNWLVEGRWREKWQMARQSRALHLYAALCLLLLLAMLWTRNTAYGWSLLQVKIPLLVVPLILLTTRQLTGKPRTVVLAVYAITVLVVSIIGLVRMLTIPDLPYRDAVPYISHIRFALNCCMVAVLAATATRPEQNGWRIPAAVGRVLLVGWMLAFMLLIHSYTAFAILAVVSLVLILVYMRRWWAIAAWLLLAGGAALAIGLEVGSYYRMVPMATQPLQATTAAGRPYTHACDGIVENGNYINNYVCQEELRAEWNKRSALDYDGNTASGYSVESTLVRYLNACGLSKDSAGMAALPDEGLRAVERGVANPVYESANPLRKMVYVMLLEREFYVHTHSVAGFTMLQRFELWNATWKVVRRNPALGVGTGDVADCVSFELYKADSELADSGKHTHNQYLSLLAAFGILGAAVVLFFALRLLLSRAPISPLMLAWLIALFISFITEDTLDTLAGILFCTWFLAFRQSRQHIQTK